MLFEDIVFKADNLTDVSEAHGSTDATSMEICVSML
jgi:hypothetical protein